MKTLPTLFAAFLLAGATAQGAIYSFSYNSGFQYGGAIPDANTTGWTDTDVIGIDVGITLLSAENLRGGSVWRWFMANKEITAALEKAGIK